MLELDDPRWQDLWTSNKPGTWIPQWLRQLLESPNNLDLFTKECWALCSEEITWSAAFAATPYLVQVAARAELKERLVYINFIGAIVRYRIPVGSAEPYGECPPNLEGSFRDAITVALRLAIELIPQAQTEAEVCYLLASIAAFKGFPLLSCGMADQAPATPVADIEF